MLAPPTSDSWAWSHQIVHNLEVYIDNMVTKTTEGHIHVADLEVVLQSINKYNMRLNPAKCSFKVQALNFLKYMLAKRGIEANLDKWQAVINTRSPTNIKKMNRLIGHLGALTHFLPCADDKVFLSLPP